MPVRLYAVPWMPLFRVGGGGRFALADPGGGHPTSGPKALVYGTWDRARGSACTHLMRNSWRDACIVRVTDLRPELGLIDWAALDADPECERIREERR